MRDMRTELIHPLLVHFPIALLLVGSAIRFLHFILRQKSIGKVVLSLSWILLFLGVCFAWLTVLAGEFAEDIVRSSLCKLDVLEDHKNLGYTTAILFSVALVFDIGKSWIKHSILRLLLTIATAIIYLTGSAILILTGKYGGSLVYDQGAAVEKNCRFD